MSEPLPRRRAGRGPRFVYSRAARVRTARRNVVLVSGPDRSATFSFSPDEFDLACLFDGNRTVAEVLDEFYEVKGLRMAAAHLDEFVETMRGAGLLVEPEVATGAAGDTAAREEPAEGGAGAGEGVRRATGAAAPGPDGPATMPAPAVPDDLDDEADLDELSALTGGEGLLTGGEDPTGDSGTGEGRQDWREPRLAEPIGVPADDQPATAVRRLRRAGPSRFGPRRGKVRRGFVVALVLALLAAAGSLPYTYSPGGEFVIMPGRRADVRALVPGDIREIYVREGERVEAGELLGRLASDEESTNIAVSRSRIAELEAKLALTVGGATQEEIALARQKVQTAQTRYNFSRERADRMEALIGRNVIARQDYEDALAEAEVDRERLAEARAGLEQLLSGARPEEITAIRAEIAKEEAQLAYHRTQLRYTELRATIDGHVVSGSLLYAVGDYLEKGDLLLSIEDIDTVLAEIKVPEADIGEVRIGAAVRIKAWAYPARDFTGTVTSIAPNAEEGEYGKVVRVLTQIENGDYLLKSELTGRAKVRGSTQPAFFVFTRMLQRFFQVELWSWLP